MTARRAVVSGPMTARGVTSLLAPTVGWERSEEAVAASIRRLTLDGGELSPAEVMQVLEDLALEQGIVGVTARFLVTRTSSNPTMAAVTPRPASIAPAAPDDVAPASVRLSGTIGVHEVVAALAPLLGQDKTEAAVQAAIRRIGAPKERLEPAEALRLLDDLGHQDGIVGTVARFARGRVMARFGR